MRAIGAIVFAIWASGLLGQPALAEKRIALSIGNSNYQNVSHLTNPASDASRLAATFRKANFDVVTLRTDLTASEIRRALREFGDKARDADVAVIYYAGHGIEVDGINYLIPIDASLEHDTDVYDEALSLERVLVAVEPARRLRLIILDACRDNPFTKTMRQTIARRSIGRGLAKVEPPSPNTMIAFAAKAGFTASDGDNGRCHNRWQQRRHAAWNGQPDGRKDHLLLRIWADAVLRRPLHPEVTPRRKQPSIGDRYAGRPAIRADLSLPACSEKWERHEPRS